MQGPQTTRFVLRTPAAVAGAAVTAAAVTLLGSLVSCSAPVGNAGAESAAPGAVRTAARGPSDADDVAFTAAELAAIRTLSPLPPVPADPTNAVADDPAAARLGQWLFFDARLSASGAVSCATCHEPERNWTDGQPTPKQFGKKLRHVPSLWNVAYNRWFYWDGRADTLWAQALEPLESRFEHGGTRGQFAQVIREDSALCAAYERVFGPLPDADGAGTGSADAEGPVDRIFTNIGKAIAAYERRIVSRRSPFDVFVEELAAGRANGRDGAREGARDGPGDGARAISPAAQRGLKIFVGPGNCMSCHHGPNFSDGEFHDTGIHAGMPAGIKDQGRLDGVNHLLANPFNALGPFSDDAAGKRTHPSSFLVNNVENRGRYKTPTLRNVAVTAPYMHRGQLATLRDVVEFYSTLPVAQNAPDESASALRTVGRSPSEHSHDSAVGGEGVLVPLNLSAAQIDDLVAFLSTLTDVNIDFSLMRAPASPGLEHSTGGPGGRPGSAAGTGQKLPVYTGTPNR